MSKDTTAGLVDHLFRHQYGKLVAGLSRAFGLNQLELIEDCIQDTFLQASIKWRVKAPENPEAWLSLAARNRAIDLLRQGKARESRERAIQSKLTPDTLNDYFLDHEVEDSQLRMIFVACHPSFSREEQIAFALKTVSGFSMREIASALAIKEESIKKRLSRARKKIKSEGIVLGYPAPAQIKDRMAGVLQIIYLIFNEGFQSVKSDSLLDQELCGEALRLAKLLLIKQEFRSGAVYALFSLMCFHSSRLESRMESGVMVDLKNQDRSKWHMPLILMGNKALETAMSYTDRSSYLWEAAIAAEHVRAIKFENTDWNAILDYYDRILESMDSVHILLSKIVALLHAGKLDTAKMLLDDIVPAGLNQRLYLLYGTYAEYYIFREQFDKAVAYLNKALENCAHKAEQEYIRNKRSSLLH